MSSNAITFHLFSEIITRLRWWFFTFTVQCPICVHFPLFVNRSDGKFSLLWSPFGDLVGDIEPSAKNAINLCVRATNDNNRLDNQYYEQKWLCVSRLCWPTKHKQQQFIQNDMIRKERETNIEQWLDVIFFWLSKWKSYQWDTFCYYGAERLLSSQIQS